jgi:hypothetical protein
MTRKTAACVATAAANNAKLAHIQVARVVGRDLIRANEEAHQEAVALAELLDGVAASNAVALQRLTLCSSPQRRMVGGGISGLLGRVVPSS